MRWVCLGGVVCAALLGCKEDVDVAAPISPERMRTDVEFLTDDSLGGRIPGSVGHAASREYLIRVMEEAGLEPFGTDGFVHRYDTVSNQMRFQFDEAGQVVVNTATDGFNLVGVLRGSDPQLANEFIVVMAHYDHLGVNAQGEVFNGAYDNAGGVAIALEVARALVRPEARPKRSVIIMMTDDEENGLRGAEQWLASGLVEKENIVMGLSADPLGRRLLPDFGCILLSGVERSPALLAFLRETRPFSEDPIFFIHRGVIPIFASDQDKFIDENIGIPGAWMVTPGFAFYHQTTDTADTIDYRILLNVARYLTRMLKHMGDTDERFAFEGEPPMNADTAMELLALLENIQASTVLSEEERERVREFERPLREAMVADSFEVVPNREALFIDAVFYTMFVLSGDHPGPIPPPFPTPSGTGN